MYFSTILYFLKIKIDVMNIAKNKRTGKCTNEKVRTNYNKLHVLQSTIVKKCVQICVKSINNIPSQCKIFSCHFFVQIASIKSYIYILHNTHIYYILHIYNIYTHVFTKCSIFLHLLQTFHLLDL